MSTISEQLREALERFYDKDTYSFHRTNAEVFIMNNLLPLLTEHEKLERESEAGKALRNAIEKIQERHVGSSVSGKYIEIADALYDYRTACEK